MYETFLGFSSTVKLKKGIGNLFSQHQSFFLTVTVKNFSLEYLFQGRVKRRKKLREKWFFDCSCPRCSDPTEFGSHVSTLKCDNESCSGLLLPKGPESEDQICSTCGYLITAKAIDKLENE